MGEGVAIQKDTSLYPEERQILKVVGGEGSSLVLSFLSLTFTDCYLLLARCIVQCLSSVPYS